MRDLELIQRDSIGLREAERNLRKNRSEILRVSTIEVHVFVRFYVCIILFHQRITNFYYTIFILSKFTLKLNLFM